MKLTLQLVMKVKRYYDILEVIFDNKILTNKNREGLSVLDENLNQLYYFHIENDFLVAHYYLSDDRTKLLIYNSTYSYFHYIDLKDSLFKPIKSNLPREFILGPYYVWDNKSNSFIINESPNVFIKYNIDNHEVEVFDEVYINEEYPGFQSLLSLEQTRYLLYQDIKRQVFIYRTVGDENNIIYWKDFITNKEVQFPAPAIDIFAAEYLDDLLVLMHEEYVFFYDLDKEIHRLEVKDPFFSMYTRLFKKNGSIYAVSLTGKINPPYQSRIKLYRIDDYKLNIWKRIVGFFKKHWN